MPYVHKHTLIEKIASYGENPPAHWTRIQLESRLVELELTHGPPSDVLRKKAMSELTKAGKRKADLQILLQTKYHLTLTGHETIKQLYALGCREVMMASPPLGTDVLEYGKYSDMTYKDVLTQFPQYVEWTIQTFQENGGPQGESNWRLKRFALWCLQQNEEIKTKAKINIPAPKAKKGYKGSSQLEMGTTSDSSFSMVQPPSAAEMVKVPSEEEMVSDAECRIQELEAEIRALQRRQKDKKSRPAVPQ